MQPESKQSQCHNRFNLRAGESTIALIVTLLAWGWTQCMSPTLPSGTALRNAAESGDMRIIERASLAELNQPDHSDTLPIIAAARCGQAAVVETMLRRGVNANLPVPFYGSATIVASSMGCTDVVRVLLRHGATLDARDGLGRDALIAAAECSNPSCIRLLLDAGANPENADNEGFTARQRAAENHDAACLRLLSSDHITVASLEKSIKN